MNIEKPLRIVSMGQLSLSLLTHFSGLDIDDSFFDRLLGEELVFENLHKDLVNQTTIEQMKGEVG